MKAKEINTALARCAKQIAVTEIHCLKATGREYTMWRPAILLCRERFVREWELRRPTLSHLVIQRHDCRKILIFFSSRRHFQRQSGLCSYIIYTVFLLPRRDQASASKMEKVQTTESVCYGAVGQSWTETDSNLCCRTHIIGIEPSTMSVVNTLTPTDASNAI